MNYQELINYYNKTRAEDFVFAYEQANKRTIEHLEKHLQGITGGDVKHEMYLGLYEALLYVKGMTKMRDYLK
jgi:hypothetical protein